MQSLNLSYEELVDLIYTIPSTSKSTVQLMQQLSNLLNASLVQIIAMDFEHQVISHNVSAGTIAEEDLAAADVLYHQYPPDADPRWAEFLNTQRQGWYCSKSHINDSFIKESALYQDIILPVGVYYTHGHSIVLDESLCVALVIHTSYERGILQQHEFNFLDRLMPHLKRVVSLQRHLYQYSVQSLVGYEIINKLPQPIVLLNLSGGIAYFNHAAQQLSQHTQIFQLEKQLKLIAPYNEQLKKTLSYIDKTYRQRQLNVRHRIEDGVIKITDHSNESLYIFISLLIGEKEVKVFGVRPLLMLTFYYPKFHLKINMHLLHSAFNLTPAESKIAILLIDGYLIKEIAQKHHVETDTIRKQLQSIYRKTNTCGQAELIRLLLNFPKEL